MNEKNNPGTEPENTAENTEISNRAIHDSMFIHTFSEPENVKGFLKLALPDDIYQNLDLTDIRIETTTYIADKMKKLSSDLVVKTRLKNHEETVTPVDIYLLMEHKSSPEKNSLVQVLKYLYCEWQKDVDQKLPLRVILPLIFYHGEKKWTVPFRFVDQFNIPDHFKEYMLDYKYLFFDTREWDFFNIDNREVRENIYLLTSLMLLKSAFNDDWDTIIHIFNLWHEKGIANDRDRVTRFLWYISETKDVSLEKVTQTLKETKTLGGELMASLAQRLRDEGRVEGREEGRLEGRLEGRVEGIRESRVEMAKRMLHKNKSIDEIIEFTGLSEYEIKKMIH